jgi:hypothetical protein
MKAATKLLIIASIPFLVAWVMPEPADIPVPDASEALNPEHLDGPFTGGFGEQTCHSCHFDYDLNKEGGSLSLSGVPDVLTPGDEVEMTVAVESEHLRNGGFQMTARFEDGSQAGSFEWDDDRLMLTPGISDEIEYLQHSADGISPTGEREVSWTFTWIAPDESQPVHFHIAANAGNDDDSAFGDWIYTKELVLESE